MTGRQAGRDGGRGGGWLARQVVHGRTCSWLELTRRPMANRIDLVASPMHQMCGKDNNQEALCMEATAKSIIEAFDNGFDPDAAP